MPGRGRYARLTRAQADAVKKLTRIERNARAKSRYQRKKNFKLTLGGSGELKAKLSPFPTTQFCEMVYTDQRGLTSAASQGVTGNEIVYRLNSIYEPRPGGLFRALGWDQVSAIYQQYKVHYVKIKVDYYNPEDDGLVWVMAIRAPGNLANTNAQFSSTLDMKNMHWTGQINNTGSQIVTRKKSYKVGKLAGLTDLQFKADTEDYCSPIFTNPSKIPVIALNVANSKDATARTLAFKIQITYGVQLYDRHQLVSSVIP